MWIPFVTDPIGTSSSGTFGQRGANISRDTAPWSFATPFTLLLVPIARRAIPNFSPAFCGSSRPSPMNRGKGSPSSLAICPKYRSVMSGGNASNPAGTGVCVVEHVRPHRRLSRGAELRPRRLHELSNPLQGQERGVALVEVAHRGLDPQRLQRPHPADPEDHLLPEAHLLVAAVQRVG